MHVVIVTFPAPRMNAKDARALLEATAPSYQQIAGLQRKYFIGNETHAGGIYQWQAKAAALTYFSDEWYAQMQSRYGVDPQVTHFDAPCLVDNIVGECLLD